MIQPLRDPRQPKPVPLPVEGDAQRRQWFRRVDIYLVLVQSSLL